MRIIQWIVAAGTAIFVALVGFFQWRTAQQKAGPRTADRQEPTEALATKVTRLNEKLAKLKAEMGKLAGVGGTRGYTRTQ